MNNDVVGELLGSKDADIISSAGNSGKESKSDDEAELHHEKLCQEGSITHKGQSIRTIVSGVGSRNYPKKQIETREKSFKESFGRCTLMYPCGCYGMSC